MITTQEKTWQMTLIPLGILLSLVFPLPQVLLDIGLCINLIFTFTLVFWVFSLKSIYSAKLFPPLFLYLCLFRLGLNLASTRWILSSGWASPMIFSLGRFFSLGSLGAGVITCCLFFLVNFLVVAKGAERVAEVRARFILEALPGKQMSLDSDVFQGRLSSVDVEKVKQDLFEESDFFSSMEGVFRFIKGDAIVGCILLIVNSCAAIYFASSLDCDSYSFWLTVIGDALVSQVPALLTSCAAATLISKVGKRDTLIEHMHHYYEQVREQFRIIAFVFSFFLFIPGIPKTLIVICVTSLLLGYKKKSQEDVMSPQWENLQKLYLYLPQEYSGKDPHSVYHQACVAVFEELGIALPRQLCVMHTGKTLCLSYEGQPFYFKEMTLDSLLPILRSLAPEVLHGKHIKALIRNAQEVWGISVDEIIPKKISENSLMFLAKALVRERISLRFFPKILESIALYGSHEENIETLVEKVRKHLGKHIGRSLLDKENALEIITLDVHVERMISDLYSQSHPLMCNKVVNQVKSILQRSQGGDFRAIVTGYESRCELRKIIEPHFPDLLVLSHNELPEEIPLSLLGSVSDEVLAL